MSKTTIYDNIDKILIKDYVKDYIKILRIEITIIQPDIYFYLCNL